MIDRPARAGECVWMEDPVWKATLHGEPGTAHFAPATDQTEADLDAIGEDVCAIMIGDVLRVMGRMHDGVKHVCVTQCPLPRVARLVEELPEGLETLILEMIDVTTPQLITKLPRGLRRLHLSGSGLRLPTNFAFPPGLEVLIAQNLPGLESATLPTSVRVFELTRQMNFSGAFPRCDTQPPRFSHVLERIALANVDLWELRAPLLARHVVLDDCDAPKHVDVGAIAPSAVAVHMWHVRGMASADAPTFMCQMAFRECKDLKRVRVAPAEH